MSHVLNFALREVLGPDVDQRGSSVNEERLRFDFSCPRGLKVEEVEAVEQIVNKAIADKLEVSSSVVSLKNAMEINGLRAVFGEVYPDPVRVISVGPAVSQLLEDPKKPAWRSSSVEFCGGTHLTNTEQAVAFVLTEETAVAKGIRRITGITGELAARAHQAGIELQSAVNSIAASAVSLKTMDDVTTAETDIARVRSEMERETLSQSVKSTLRGQVEKIQKDIFLVKKRLSLAALQDNILIAKQTAANLANSGQKKIVLTLDIGFDAAAIKLASEEIRKAAPGVAFLCISADSEKLACFAFVPEEMTESVQANAWVSKTLESCGGKGGGRPGNAQGSGLLGSKSKDAALRTALDIARSFVE
jgi:alanyl-tRNA synthetase